MQGDGGNDSITTSNVAAGSILRIFGSALAIDPMSGDCMPLRMPDARLPPSALIPSVWPPGLAAAFAIPPQNTATIVSLCVGSTTTCINLPVILASCHRIDVEIPTNVVPGMYSLHVDNGLASTLDGTGVLDTEHSIVIISQQSWPTRTWVVGTDCSTPSVCIATASAAGGGTVSLPAGVFDLNADEFLTLNNFVALIGSGPASILRWTSNTFSEAPIAAIECNGTARMENFTILALSPVQAGLKISGSACTANGLNITIDVAGDFHIGPTVSVALADHFSFTNSYLFHRGNCSRSWPFNTAFTVWGSHDGIFANNSVSCYCQGHSTDSSSRVVYDGNAVFSLGSLSQGSGYSTFENPNVLENIYEGRRIDVGNSAAIKRFESMTFDGPGGAAFSTFDSISHNGTSGMSQTLSLSIPGRNSGYGDKNVSEWVGAHVSILFGPGLGSTARIVGVTPDDATWATARVWTLFPPLVGGVVGESYVAINPHRGGFIFEATAYLNATTFQLWAQATDTILVGSYFQDVVGDVRNWPLQYQCPWKDGFACAWQPNIGCDFMHTTTRCSKGGVSATSSDYGANPPVSLTLGIALTRRNMTLIGGNMSASGRFDDMLIEHTHFAADESCDGVSGDYNINASIPHVLIR